MLQLEHQLIKSMNAGSMRTRCQHDTDDTNSPFYSINRCSSVFKTTLKFTKPKCNAFYPNLLIFEKLQWIFLLKFWGNGTKPSKFSKVWRKSTKIWEILGSQPNIPTEFSDILTFFPKTSSNFGVNHHILYDIVESQKNTSNVPQVMGNWDRSYETYSK